MTRQYLSLVFVVFLLAPAAIACSEDEGAGAGTNITTGQGYGEQCTLNVNCRTGLSCVDGACLPTGETALGDACTLSAECQEGLYCSAEGACAEAGAALVDEVCQATSECVSGAVCRPVGFVGLCRETGEVDLGDACQDTSDCLAGLGCVEQVCTAGGDVPGFSPALPATCERNTEGPPKVFFEVPRGDVTEFYRLPFPNDVRLTGGQIDLTGHILPSGTDAAAAAFAELVHALETDIDGFSQNPAVIFRFSRAIDLDSLKDADGNARFKLYDLTPGEEFYGKEHSLAWAAVSGGGTGGPYHCENWLGMRVAWGRPLRPGHTYTVVMTRGVRGAEAGPELVADDDLSALLSANAPTDSALTAPYTAYAPLRDFLADQGIAPTDVIGATVFTTQTNKDIVPQVREAVRAEPSPQLDQLTLCEDGVVSPCDDGLEGDAHRRGCLAVHDDYYELHATVSLPIFQEGTAPYFEPADGGAIALDGSGNPTVVRHEDVCVSLTVPKDGTMPAEGWPLVIYAHGTGGTFRSHAAGDLAQQLSTLAPGSSPSGFAVLGFDQVVHGSRANGSVLTPEVLYFNYANPRAARGHLLQGAADLFALARLAEDGFEVLATDSPTGDDVRFDPTQVVFLGHSQGTQYGVITLPYERNFSGVVLSGAGGGLLRSLLSKTEPIDIVTGVKAALGQPEVGEYNPILNLVQTYFDSVDPVNFSEYVLYNVEDGVQRPHVMHFYGIDDHYTPEPTQDALAVGLGSFLVEPSPKPLGGVNTTELPASANFSGVTALLRIYEADGDYDGHFVMFDHEQARADLRSFLGSYLADGVPTLE